MIALAMTLHAKSTLNSWSCVGVASTKAARLAATEVILVTVWPIIIASAVVAHQGLVAKPPRAIAQWVTGPLLSSVKETAAETSAKA